MMDKQSNTHAIIVTSDMQGLDWLAHEYDFEVENIIQKFEVCNVEEYNLLVY